MMTMRAAIFVTLASVLACASSAGDPSPTVTRVAITSTAGSMGATELHNDPGSASRTLSVPIDSVWPLLQRAYQALEIPDAGTDPGRQFYGSLNFRPRRIDGKRLSAFIDCGYGPTATPKADEYEITMSLTSSLAAATDTTTIVRTVLEASGRPRATAGQRVSCQSIGTLEKRVGDLLVVLTATR